MTELATERKLPMQPSKLALQAAFFLSIAGQRAVPMDVPTTSGEASERDGLELLGELEALEAVDEEGKEDDRPLTDELEADLKAARREIADGRGIPGSEVRRDE